MIEDDPDVVVMDLAAEAWQLWMSGYSSGYFHGLERGRQDERDDAAAIWQRVRRIVRNGLTERPREVA